MAMSGCTENDPSRDKSEAAKEKGWARVLWPSLLSSGVVGGDLFGQYKRHEPHCGTHLLQGHGEVVVRLDEHRPHLLLPGASVPR